MKRIGTTDQGGILMEMTEDDLNRVRQAWDAFADLLVQGSNHGIVMPPAPQPFEATGTRQHDELIKVKTIKPVALKTRKYVKVQKPRAPSMAHAKEVASVATAKSTDGKPTYRRVYEVLAAAGPLTSSDLAIACGKHGLETTTAKLGVMLSTYPKLFKRGADHTWVATGVEKIKPVAPDPKVTVAPSRMDAIREADRRARERRGEMDPLERAASIASGIREEEG